MPKRSAATISLGDVRDMSADLDLGLRMVEGLVRIGELGSAARLTDELRGISAETLGRPVKTPRIERVPRRVVVGAGVAAVLGLSGLSAAAMLGPTDVARPAQVAPAPARTQDATPVQPLPGEVSATVATAPEAAVPEAAEAVSPHVGPNVTPNDPSLLPPGFVPPIEPSQLPTAQTPSTDH